MGKAVPPAGGADEERPLNRGQEARLDAALAEYRDHTFAHWSAPDGFTAHSPLGDRRIAAAIRAAPPPVLPRRRLRYSLAAAAAAVGVLAVTVALSTVREAPPAVPDAGVLLAAATPGGGVGRSPGGEPGNAGEFPDAGRAGLRQGGGRSRPRPSDPPENSPPMPLRKIVSLALVAAGLSPETPAACIADGATPQQRSVRAPLSQIASAADEGGFAPPAITVIGDVVDVLPDAAIIDMTTQQATTEGTGETDA